MPCKVAHLFAKTLCKVAHFFVVSLLTLQENLGTEPTKVNKIKGLRGLGGRARAEGRKRDFLRGLPAFSAGLLALLACLWCT